jgi:hypothetical protein
MVAVQEVPPSSGATVMKQTLSDHIEVYEHLTRPPA